MVETTFAEKLILAAWHNPIDGYGNTSDPLPVVDKLLSSAHFNITVLKAAAGF